MHLCLPFLLFCIFLSCTWLSRLQHLWLWIAVENIHKHTHVVKQNTMTRTCKCGKMPHLRGRTDGASSSEQLVEHAHVSAGRGLGHADDFGPLPTLSAPLRLVRQICIVLWWINHESMTWTWRRSGARRGVVVDRNKNFLYRTLALSPALSLSLARVIRMFCCFEMAHVHKINIWTQLSTHVH